VKLIIDLIPTKYNMSKDLHQSKKIVSGLRMNYEKIDACENKCMLFWKEHKDDNEYMHCGRSRYVKVINEDGASVPTKMVVKQLHYIPISTRLKRLFLRKGICHTQFSHQNQVLIVCMSQDQLFHTYGPKGFTDNQMSRIKYDYYYINNVSKDYDDSQQNRTAEDSITPQERQPGQHVA
jgi:hypothetical protein